MKEPQWTREEAMFIGDKVINKVLPVYYLLEMAIEEGKVDITLIKSSHKSLVDLIKWAQEIQERS